MVQDYGVIVTNNGCFPVHAMQLHRVSYLNLGTVWRWVVKSVLRPLYPGTKPDAQWIRRWLGSQIRPGRFWKKNSWYLQGFKPWTVQLVAKSLLMRSGKIQLLALPCLSGTAYLIFFF